MGEERSLWRTLPRVYFSVWVALIAVAIFCGFVFYMSFDREFDDFLDGLWVGILNLGILWTAVFLIVLAVGCIARVRRAKDRLPQPAVSAGAFWEEFWPIYSWGWIAVISLGFLLEFLTHTFGEGGGLMATIALCFLPMTLATALIAHFRSRNR